MRTALTKSLLVTALSVAGGFAHAEGFNFYALIDGGVAKTSISHGGQSRTEFVTGGYAPNFMGLSAEKSLGSGLSGGFKLEQGFLLNGKTVFDQYGAFGPDSLFNRQANAWVKGDFGTVTLGTQSNIAFGSVLLGEPRAGSNLGSALATIDLDGGLGTVDQAAVSYQIVLTKADKIKPAEVDKVVAETQKAIAKRPAAFPRVLATSSEKGLGLPDLRAEIVRVCIDE